MRKAIIHAFIKLQRKLKKNKRKLKMLKIQELKKLMIVLYLTLFLTACGNKPKITATINGGISPVFPSINVIEELEKCELGENAKAWLSRIYILNEEAAEIEKLR